MAEKMTKFKAEKALGLTGTYSFKDLTKAYRAAVKKAHPDMGGSEDEMVTINQAKDYLDTYFDIDKSATVTCSTTDTQASAASTSAASSASSAYSAAPNWNARDNAEYAKQASSFVDDYFTQDYERTNAEDTSENWSDEFADFVNQWAGTYAGSERMDAKAEAAWRGARGESFDTDAYVAAARDAGRSVAEELGYDASADMKAKVAYAATSAVVDAAANYVKDNDSKQARVQLKREKIEGAPAWWNAANWLASKFWWRITYWAIMAAIAYPVLANGTDSTPEGALTLCFCLFTSILNIFGLITTPIKKAIRKKADTALMNWAKGKGKKVNWKKSKIVAA